MDVFEQISEKVESLINDLIKNLIDEKNSNDLLKEIYFKKFEDLKGRIDNFLKMNNIYEIDETTNIRGDDTKSISRISSEYSYSGNSAPPAPNS